MFFVFFFVFLLNVAYSTAGEIKENIKLYFFSQSFCCQLHFKYLSGLNILVIFSEMKENNV